MGDNVCGQCNDEEIGTCEFALEDVIKIPVAHKLNYIHIILYNKFGENEFGSVGLRVGADLRVDWFIRNLVEH